MEGQVLEGGIKREKPLKTFCKVTQSRSLVPIIKKALSSLQIIKCAIK